MERAFSAGDILFGVFYPRGYIVAVFDEPQIAEEVLDVLIQHGIERDDARSWTSQNALDYRENLQENLSAISQLAAKLPLSRTEQAVADRYLKFAQNGCEFLTVRITDEDQIETVRALLAGNGAHSMRYYGNWTISDLSGASVTNSDS